MSNSIQTIKKKLTKLKRYMRKSVGRANMATVFFEKLLVLLQVFEKLKSFFTVSILKKNVNFF